jgi:hypothetical protein
MRRPVRPGRGVKALNRSIDNLGNSVVKFIGVNDVSSRDGINRFQCAPR